jgi:hypothetical protein
LPSWFLVYFVLRWALMSRKTRKQKIMADQRRQSAPKVLPMAAALEPVAKPPEKEPEKTAPEYASVKHDLLKTAFLSVLAIGGQIVLWYLLGRK